MAPKRIVLRFNEKYILEHATIVQRFFDLHDDQSTEDFFEHLCPANTSANMYIVLDLHCKEYPAVDVSQLEYKIFKVKKVEDLYSCPESITSMANKRVSQFKQLQFDAPKLASQRCSDLIWGTDRRLS